MYNRNTFSTYIIPKLFPRDLQMFSIQKYYVKEKIKDFVVPVLYFRYIIYIYIECAVNAYRIQRILHIIRGNIICIHRTTYMDWIYVRLLLCVESHRPYMYIYLQLTCTIFILWCILFNSCFTYNRIYPAWITSLPLGKNVYTSPYNHDV